MEGRIFIGNVKFPKKTIIFDYNIKFSMIQKKVIRCPTHSLPCHRLKNDNVPPSKSPNTLLFIQYYKKHIHSLHQLAKTITTDRQFNNYSISPPSEGIFQFE